jgi:hypothetical protein
MEDLEFADPSLVDATANLAMSICERLDTNLDIVEAADHDSTRTDISIVGEMNQLALDLARQAIADDEVSVVVFGAMGEHLCPQHQDALLGYLQEIG